MQKLGTRILLIAGIVAVSLGWYYRELLAYGVAQGRGQFRVLMDAQPIDYYLENPNFPDSLKTKIRLIEEVKIFAIGELGLNPSNSYSKVFDQQGKDILWNVSASDEFALEPYEWTFPIVGTVGYKGYFDRAAADSEKARLDELGYDTNIRSVGAWSTLGWFNDPIMSNMLYRREGQLAELIIHELTHGTVFVRDSLRFNENLATFVGYIGAIHYLEKKYGKGSAQVDNYIRSEEDYRMFLAHMLRGAKQLDSLYEEISDLPIETKREIKQEKIEEIVRTLDTVSFYQPSRFARIYRQRLPNNANLMSFLRYHSQRDLLTDQYLNNFDSNIKAYILFLKDKYGV